MTLVDIHDDLGRLIDGELTCDCCGNKAFTDDAPEGWAVVGSDEPFVCDIDETDIHLCEECAQKYNIQCPSCQTWFHTNEFLSSGIRARCPNCYDLIPQPLVEYGQEYLKALDRYVNDEPQQVTYEPQSEKTEEFQDVELILYTSPFKLALHYILKLVLIVGIIMLLYNDPMDARGLLSIGWGIVIVMIWMYLTDAIHLSTTKPRLTINNKGIKNSYWNDLFIPWEDIEKIRSVSQIMGTSIDLQLKKKNADKYYSQFPKMFSMFGQKYWKSSLSLRIYCLNKSASAVWTDCILKLGAAHMAVLNGGNWN